MSKNRMSMIKSKEMTSYSDSNGSAIHWRQQIAEGSFTELEKLWSCGIISLDSYRWTLIQISDLWFGFQQAKSTRVCLPCIGAMLSSIPQNVCETWNFMFFQPHGTIYLHTHPFRLSRYFDVCYSHIQTAQSIRSCRFVNVTFIVVLYWQYLSTSIDPDFTYSINTNIRYTKKEEERASLLQVELSWKRIK